MERNGRGKILIAFLTAAVIVRALAATGVDAAAQRALTGEFDAERLAPPAPPAQTTEDRVWVLHVLPPADEPPAPAEPEPEMPEKPPYPPFTEAEAEDLSVAGSSTYDVDKAALLLAPGPLDLSLAGAKVLVVHTHTCEAYTQSPGWEYPESDALRTTDPERSVVQVGRVVAEELTAAGIETLHDETLHDYPRYNGAYARSLETVERELAEHPSVQVVVDLHRDAAADPEGNPLRQTVTTPEGEAARIMLVVGTDEGGLTHPGWRDNLSFALKVQAAAERIAPGICRSVDLRRERFNQHVRPGAVLAEIGSTGNTLPEAILAGKIFARALADAMTIASADRV